MRSTKASAAVERLKRRSGDAYYSMVRTSDGLFYLAQTSDTGTLVKLSDPLEQDEFVRHVNGINPEKPRRISKLDVAFEKQLIKKNASDAS